MKGMNVIDYKVEICVAQGAAIAGIAGGGAVALATHNVGWGLLAALACGFVAWILVQVARTEPQSPALAMNPLDVLQPSWPPETTSRENATFPPQLQESSYRPWPPVIRRQPMTPPRRRNRSGC